MQQDASVGLSSIAFPHFRWNLYTAATLDGISGTLIVRPNDKSVANAHRMFNQFAERFNSHLEGKAFICGEE